MFVIVTLWIQPFLGICTQQSSPKAVCVVLWLAGGSLPSAWAFSPPPKRFFPPENSSPGEETFDPSHLLHIWPGCYHPYLLKGSEVPQAVCVLQVKMPGCGMVVLTALVSFLFLLWALFQTGSGEGGQWQLAGTTKEQSWAPAELVQSRQIHPWARKAEKLLQACTAQLHSLWNDHILHRAAPSDWSSKESQPERHRCAWSLALALCASPLCCCSRLRGLRPLGSSRCCAELLRGCWQKQRLHLSGETLGLCRLDASGPQEWSNSTGAVCAQWKF